MITFLARVTRKIRFRGRAAGTDGTPDPIQLTARIRIAWDVTVAALPIPPSGMACEMDDPEVASTMQARDQAFGWALNEVVGGRYPVPDDITGLGNGGPSS